MWNGWTGVSLEIDLSRGTVEKRQGDRAMYEAYLGGLGLITKLFWDRVPPETEPFSPDNPLIFGAGPLVGTASPGANRTLLVTRSPVTNYLNYPSMGGFWGPELKFAGYDTLIVSRKSPSPVYICINNERVEIRDASHLWGKSISETQHLIRAELNSMESQIMCIGLAGENRVSFASIEHGPGCSMSRAGPGTIMGDKNLKAIAVQGNRDVAIARPEQFLQVCNDILKRADRVIEYINKHQHNMSHTDRLGSTYFRNSEVMKPWEEAGQVHMDFLSKRGALKLGCFNCNQKCIRSPHLSDGHPVFLKCRAPFRFVNAADIQDYGFNLNCVSLAQRYGLDVLSAAAVCAFAVDLYQKGILTKGDTDGMHLEWGNPEVFPSLLEKIAHREGIGDVLAEGVYQAACQIGRGAEQYAYHMRKLEPRGYSIRSLPHAWLLSDRQDSTSWVNACRGALSPSGTVSHGAESGDWYAESVYWAYPQEWKEYRKRRLDVTEIDYEMEAKTIAYDAFSTFLTDCSGLCRFWSAFKIYSPIRDWDQSELLSYSTGLDLNEEEVKKCARRAKALVRAYNAILGERNKIDDLPKVIGFENVNRNDLSKVMEGANREMGCNAEGIPMREPLMEIGLDYVAEELDRRGILPK